MRALDARSVVHGFLFRTQRWRSRNALLDEPQRQRDSAVEDAPLDEQQRPPGPGGGRLTWDSFRDAFQGACGVFLVLALVGLVVIKVGIFLLTETFVGTIFHVFTNVLYRER